MVRGLSRFELSGREVAYNGTTYDMDMYRSTRNVGNGNIAVLVSFHDI